MDDGCNLNGVRLREHDAKLSSGQFVAKQLQACRIFDKGGASVACHPSDTSIIDLALDFLCLVPLIFSLSSFLPFFQYSLIFNTRCRQSTLAKHSDIKV